MPKEHIYKCRRCKKILERDKVRKLVGQKFGEKSRFNNVYNIDLCISCHNKFIEFLKEEKNETP